MITPDLNIEDIPEWERNLIDERLDFIEKHPDKLIPIEDFIAELDNDDEVISTILHLLQEKNSLSP